MRKKHLGLISIGVGILVLLATFLISKGEKRSLLSPLIGPPPQIALQLQPLALNPTPTPRPSPSPAPTPLPFAEMNRLYGPCVVLPTLMYHHIQDLASAKLQGHASLAVDPNNFRMDMQYLKDHGFNVIPMTTLIAFFDSGSVVPKKSVLLTFDDAYDDFAMNAVPILRQFNFPATLFVPTGLVDNPGYLSWSQVMDAAGSGILMANHTWSHHNMSANQAITSKEVTTADTQLAQHGLNEPKTFAYPYGLTSQYAVSFLQSLGYKLAFTTVHGNTLCKQQRLLLPRIRIGNAPLSRYGF